MQKGRAHKEVLHKVQTPGLEVSRGLMLTLSFIVFQDVTEWSPEIWFDLKKFIQSYEKRSFFLL